MAESSKKQKKKQKIKQMKTENVSPALFFDHPTMEFLMLVIIAFSLLET